jgi:hypothetical protein
VALAARNTTGAAKDFLSGCLETGVSKQVWGTQQGFPEVPAIDFSSKNNENSLEW